MVVRELIGRDTLTLKRPAGGADAEGNPITTFNVIGERRGTWGPASSREREDAARKEHVIDAVCSGSFDAKVGDVLANLRGHDYLVVDYHWTVVHNRYFLRKIGTT